MTAFLAPAAIAGRVYLAEALPPIDGGVVVPDPIVTDVVIAPQATTVLGEATQQFTASVFGANSPPQSVVWSLVGAGTLSASGLYTAPASTNAVQNASIKATSVYTPAKFGTAVVVVPATVVQAPTPTVTGVTISPVLPTISNDSPLQFSATVQGTNSPSQEVTWELSGPGTLSSAGLYVPPAKISTAQGAAIKAISVLNPAKSDLTVVTIPPAVIVVAPYITSITINPPATVAAGGSKQITALVTGTAGFNPAVTYSVQPVNGSLGGTVDSFGFFQGPSSYLPQQFDVVATSVQDSDWTATCRVTVQALVVVAPFVPNSRMLVISPKGRGHDVSLQNADCAFIVRQGLPMIDKDPDSRLAYGMDLTPYFSEIDADLQTAVCISTGVNVNPYEVSLEGNKVLFWTSGGDVESSDNTCVIRFTGSDGTEDDRTMYFRITEL